MLRPEYLAGQIAAEGGPPPGRFYTENIRNPTNRIELADVVAVAIRPIPNDLTDYAAPNPGSCQVGHFNLIMRCAPPDRTYLSQPQSAVRASPQLCPGCESVWWDSGNAFLRLCAPDATSRDNWVSAVCYESCAPAVDGTDYAPNEQFPRPHKVWLICGL